MKLLHLKKKDRIFYSYLLSYLVIATISLALSIVGYINCHNIVQKEILTSQSYMLSQLHNTFESYVDTVIRSNKSLSGSGSISYLSNKYFYNNTDLLELNTVKNELNNAQKNVDFSSQVGIYFHKSDSIVTNTKRYASEITPLYAKSFDMTKEVFLEFLDIPDAQGYKILETGEGSTLFFIQNIYNYNYKKKLATIFTIVPWKNIADNITTIHDGQVYWINSVNQVLKGPGEFIDLGPIHYEDYGVENELIYHTIDQQNFISSFKQSQYFDFKYCMTMSKNSYFKQISYMKWVIGIQMAVALIIALVMSLYYSLKSYHPISQIITMFRDYNKLTEEPVNFDKLEHNLENLFAENTTLSNSWKRAKVELSTQVISGYIKGWNQDISTLRETIATTESITLKETPYILLIISELDIEKCNLFTDVTPEEEVESYQLLQYIYKNVFSENVLSKLTGLLCTIDGTHICIVNVHEDENFEETLKNMMMECINWYKNALNLKIMVGASKRHDHFESLTKAYNEASQVLTYQSFWGNASETLMFYNESNTMEDAESSYGVQFLENEKKLHNLLVTKEYSKAYELLDEIIEKTFIRDIKQMGINQCRMYSLINTLITSLSDIFGRSDEEFFQKLQPMKRLLKVNSIDTTKKVMKAIFDDILEYVENNLTEEQPKWLSDILSFVDTHYTDPNLNISIVADQFDMNLSYVGRTFKKHYGYGLIDYIHLQRLKECKRLLELGDSVKEAAEAVGYLDSKTLIRIFKKYEGITPGQFKNNCTTGKLLNS